jgi:hypothetical protein
VTLLDRLERPRDGARAAPREQVDRLGIVVEQEVANEVGARRVLRDVAVELHVPPPDLRAQRRRRGIVRVVNTQVRVDPLVDVDGVVDEPLARGPAPGLARAQVEAEPEVLPVRHRPLLPGPVALPVELAARVDEPLRPEIRVVEQVSDERV